MSMGNETPMILLVFESGGGGGGGYVPWLRFFTVSLEEQIANYDIFFFSEV